MQTLIKEYIGIAYMGRGALLTKYRVAAIFPEQFQSFTDALKNHIF
jgi:hypothetical protein